MKLQIVTPDTKVYEGEATAVQVPGSKGSFEVLDNHAPVVSSLDAGTVRVKEKGATHFFTIDGGVIEILNNKVVVLVESATKQ